MSKVKNSRGKNWTPEELEKFALLLVDGENCFAANLETLALKNRPIMKCFPSSTRFLIKKLNQSILFKKMLFPTSYSFL